jgi:hypothetical protein
MSKAQEAMTAKPNIIFILTYDQPESTLSYMPNIQSRPSEGGTRVEPCRLNLVLPPYEGVKEDIRFYLRCRDDPWTTKSDPGFEKFYDVGADPYQIPNLAYYGEVSQVTLDRLQDRLLRMRGGRAYSCRTAENGG